MEYKERQKGIVTESEENAERCILNKELDGKTELDHSFSHDHYRFRFDFKLGVGYDDPKKTMHLGPQDYIVMEGIHALNPLIFEGIVPTGGKPNLIYISAITPLGIDDQHPVSTSDTRLCRRILRDAKTRG